MEGTNFFCVVPNWFLSGLIHPDLRPLSSLNETVLSLLKKSALLESWKLDIIASIFFFFYYLIREVLNKWPALDVSVDELKACAMCPRWSAGDRTYPVGARSWASSDMKFFASRHLHGLALKNPACGRHWISRRVRIVATIPKWTKREWKDKKFK